MELFWKATALILVALVLVPALGKQERDLGTLLVIAVCCLTGLAALEALEPVLAFLYGLQSLAGVQRETVAVLLRITGVGLAGELAALICADGGYGSLGKSLQLLASCVMLSLALPVMEQMLTVLRDILGGV